MPRRPPVHKRVRVGHRHGHDDERPSAAARGYDRRWRKVRLIKLARSPLCEDCLAEGVTTGAVDVDHVEAIKDGGAMYDLDNLRSLCHSHHSIKTVSEDGGFGRARGEAGDTP